MKNKEIVIKTDGELILLLNNQLQQLFVFKFQLKSGRFAKTHQIKIARRTIARIKTELKKRRVDVTYALQQLAKKQKKAEQDSNKSKNNASSKVNPKEEIIEINKKNTSSEAVKKPTNSTKEQVIMNDYNKKKIEVEEENTIKDN